LIPKVVLIACEKASFAGCSGSLFPEMMTEDAKFALGF